MASKISSKEYSYTIIYEPVKEGGYQATVPLLPGLVTYGRTLEEARKMGQDAIYCYLESLLKEKAKVPQEKSILQEKVNISF
ncbi:type II toxin-antitoxin system HicB family antitoxin [Candidatus Wolfebacteria bacterium]|nr:type II toxin-antitoxin system HicB family antitoxin [Candidatus Wolfebacteria bacterium]